MQRFTTLRVMLLLCLSAIGNLSIARAESTGINRWSTNGPTGTTIASLAADPVNPTTVYAAAGPAGLFRSSDAGGRWDKVVVDAEANPSIASVAIDPRSPSIVFAAGGGIYKSTDSGATWVALGSGLPGGFVSLLAIAPSQPSTIYLRMGNPLNALFKSLDGGQTWSSLPLQKENLAGVVVDPRDSSTIYAGAVGGRKPDGGVFKSTDGGLTWIDTRVPLARPGEITIDPTNPNTLYARDAFFNEVARSIDGAGSWSVIGNLPATGGGPIVIDPIRPRTLYVGTAFGGVFRSTDSGSSWTAFNSGLTNLNVAPLAIDRSGAVLHAGTVGSGVFEYHFSEQPLTLLSGRFHVALLARDQRTDRITSGVPIPQSDIFGYFSLPAFTGNLGNPEVFVKLLDARSVNGRFWFFYGGLTDVEYTLTITDTETGATRTYQKEPGSACGGFDAAAF
jgi:photosystem II stability/assembly factor-like uncharacterized protein